MMNYFDNKLITLLATPFVVSAVLIYLATLAQFEPKLRPSENELFQFSHQSADISFKKEPVVVSNFLKSPVGINVKIKAVNLKLKSSGASKIEVKKIIPKKLTLILINESKKMAIINGFVLNEGDTIADSKIVRIEKSGVLINEEGYGEKWLKIGK